MKANSRTNVRVHSTAAAGLFFLFACLPGCASRVENKAAKPDPVVLEMAALISTRLAISEQVAWTKFVNRIPITDPDRERIVVESAVAKAAVAGVDPAVVSRFFEAQIAASKTFQFEKIRAWSRGGSLPTFGPIDLNSSIRPELDQITASLIMVLQRWPGTPAATDALDRELRRIGYSSSVTCDATRF